MKLFVLFVACVFALSACGIGFAAQDVSDDSDDDGGSNKALTGALMGGLLGAGLGAAIGSASGNAGTGAAIGAGAGAVGGTLLGASQQNSRRRTVSRDEAQPQEAEDVPKGAQVKKRVIRQYDEQGNVVSEKEVTE